MRRARANFKYRLRQCRQDEEALRAEAMSRGLAAGDSRAFWRCVSGSGATARPERIDGAVGDADVANLWATKFGSVLNSVHDERLQTQFYHALDATAESEVEHVTVAEVREIVKKLKDGKAIGLDNIPNEFFSRSPNYVLTFLSIILDSMMIHEFVPDGVMKARIKPLLKGKLLDFSLSDNYRPITISSAFSKIFIKTHSIQENQR